MPTCHNCDAHVTNRFTKVFGDEEDELHACLECASLLALTQGAGGIPEGRGQIR